MRLLVNNHVAMGRGWEIERCRIQVAMARDAFARLSLPWDHDQKGSISGRSSLSRR